MNVHHTVGTCLAAKTRRMTGQRGVTLLELVIVVAIIAILATIAVSMFSKSANKAKSSEVNTMFAEFKLRQEQYQLEHDGNYLSTGTDESNMHPASAPGSAARSLSPMPASWSSNTVPSLRMAPDKSSVYCSYVAIAGAGGDDTNIGAIANSFGMTTAPASNWYYLVAECNFDGDSTLNSFYFTSSDTDRVLVHNEGK